MSKSIAQWFVEKGRYADGLALLLEQKPNHNLRRFFSKGETPPTRRALEYELRKLAGITKTDIVKQPVTQIRVLSMVEMASIDITNYPDELKNKYIKKGKLAHEASQLRQGVVVITTKGKKTIIAPGYSIEEMQRRAKRIVECMDENQSIWDELRHFERYGSLPVKDLPPVVSVEDLSTAELITFSKNLPPWLTKEKKKINSCTDELEKKKRQVHFLEKTKLLKAVKEKLKTL